MGPTDLTLSSGYRYLFHTLVRAKIFSLRCHHFPSKEDSGEQRGRSTCVAKLADGTVVPKSNTNGHENTGQVKSLQDAPLSVKPTGTDTPLT